MHPQQFTSPEQDACSLDVHQHLLTQLIESQEVTNGAETWVAVATHLSSRKLAH